jgi:hypothetical protein
VNFLKSMLHYAQGAWSFIFGAATDPVKALESLWKFAGSIHQLFSHLFANVSRLLHWRHLSLSALMLTAISDILDALERVKKWVWSHQVNPVRRHLINRIGRLYHWTAHNLFLLRKYDIRLFFAALGYAYRLVKHERAMRIKAVSAARKYTVTLVKASLRTVDTEAAAGYNSGLQARKSLINTIADDIVNNSPLVKGLVKDLIAALEDFLAVDNPVARLALQFALSKVIDNAAVDKVTGSLLKMLISDLTGEHKAETLHDVTKDVSARLTGLEQRWAEFAADGGSEIEKAGEEWKKLGSLPVDLAIVAFLADMVADPAGWARGVNDTAGAVINGAVGAVSAVIRR